MRSTALTCISSRSLLLGSLVLASACITNPPGPTPTALRNAGAGVEHEGLASLCADYWEWSLDDDPMRATWLGEPTRHGDLPRLTRGARAQNEELLRRLITREELLDAPQLSRSDQLTRELLRFQLEQAATEHELDLEEWTLDPLDGPWAELLALASHAPESSVGRGHTVIILLLPYFNIFIVLYLTFNTHRVGSWACGWFWPALDQCFGSASWPSSRSFACDCHLG